MSSQLLQLTDPQLTSNSSVDVHFKSLNPVSGQKFVIGNDLNVSFMWELEFGKDEKSGVPIKTDFHVKYIATSCTKDVDETSVDDPLHIHDLQKFEEESNVYRCNFDVMDYVVSKNDIYIRISLSSCFV